MYISSTPANNQLDVRLDVAIQVLFTKQVDSRSLTRNVFILIDDAASKQLNCSYGQAQLPDGKWQVTIMPQRLLALNTAHKLYIIGADDTTAPAPLTFVDSSQMAVSQELTWKTGEQLTASADVRDRDAVVNFPLILDGETDLSKFMPADIKPDVQVVGQYPAEGDIAVTCDQPTLVLTFNGPILGLGPVNAPVLNPGTIAQMVRLSQEPVLSPFVLFSPKSYKFYEPVKLGQPKPADWSLPAGVWTVVGNQLIFTKSPTQFWIANSVVSATISKDIVVNVGGVPTAYGLADHKFQFAIEVYPAFTHTNMVRANLGSVSSQVSDLNIQQAILQSSIEAWRYSARAGANVLSWPQPQGLSMYDTVPIRSISLHDPSWTAQVYARMASTAKVLDNYALALDALRGRNMKLGDLSVSYNPNQSAALSGMLNAIRDELPGLIEMLSIEGGGKGNFAVGLTGTRTFRPRYYARNWDLGSRVPWANTTQERSIYQSTTTHLPVLEMF